MKNVNFPKVPTHRNLMARLGDDPSSAQLQKIGSIFLWDGILEFGPNYSLSGTLKG